MGVSWFRMYWKDLVCMSIVFLMALLPRTLDLGTFLTTDEKTWMARSYDFIQAFRDLRFNDMLQTTHPGVTTLWAAGATISAKMMLSGLPFETTTLFHFVKSTQFSIALLNSLAIPCIYVLLFFVVRRRDVALFGAFLLALDPFLIGYSRVVHVDALLGSFLTLSVLATILYARSFTRRSLIASAIFAGLALLTKFPAVFIFPFIIAALIGVHGKAVFSKEFLTARFRDALVWILIVVVMVLIIWPALVWVPNPVGNVLQVKRDVVVAASTPHDMSEDYTLNPFHYPAALLTRSNPVALLGVLLALVALGIAAYKKSVPKEMGLTLLYLVAFVVMMTLGAKKGDRYIIPAFFALHILAAYGIISGVELVAPLKTQKKAIAAVFLVSIVYLASLIIVYHPYEIAYSSPLFPDNLSQELGWGEGLDQVAAWLNANHPTATVASWYPGELQAFTTARVLHINAHEQNQVQFILLYNNMFGREPSHYANDFLDEYYKKRDPVFVVRIAGKEYAWVYEKPSYPKTIGDLDEKTIVVQEAPVDHENLAGIRIFPATRFGEANTGTLVVAISRTLHGSSFFTVEIPMKDLKDASWYPIEFPKDISVKKGEHLFVSVRAIGSSAPYASLRYAPESMRPTPIYISRTGSNADLSEKPGALSIQLDYIGIDGKVQSELQTKLLR